MFIGIQLFGGRGGGGRDRTGGLTIYITIIIIVRLCNCYTLAAFLFRFPLAPPVPLPSGAPARASELRPQPLRAPANGAPLKDQAAAKLIDGRRSLLASIICILAGRAFCSTCSGGDSLRMNDGCHWRGEPAADRAAAKHLGVFSGPTGGGQRAEQSRALLAAIVLEIQINTSRLVPPRAAL